MSDALYCSFCGKSNDEVFKLIAGPTVFICDGCVDICAEIVTEAREILLTRFAKTIGWEWPLPSSLGVGP